jgi:hypothetical protein
VEDDQTCTPEAIADLGLSRPASLTSDLSELYAEEDLNAVIDELRSYFEDLRKAYQSAIERYPKTLASLPANAWALAEEAGQELIDVHPVNPAHWLVSIDRDTSLFITQVSSQGRNEPADSVLVDSAAVFLEAIAVTLGSARAESGSSWGTIVDTILDIMRNVPGPRSPWQIFGVDSSQRLVSLLQKQYCHAR